MTFQPPNPSEETVIKREIHGDDKKSPLDLDTVTQPLTPESIHTRWNAIPGVKPCKVLGPTIRDRIQCRIKNQPGTAWWTDLFEQITKSDFLCGRIAGKGGTFHASLDWVLGPKNLDKILAGNYDSIASNGHGPSPTCTKRIQAPGDRFLYSCGQPASPESRPTEPRCARHLSEATRPKELTHAAH
jgi:hypothetical protein